MDLCDQRDNKSIPVNIKKLLDIITLKKSIIVGSFRFSCHEYPCDIDLFEKYTINNRDKDLEILVSRFKTIVAKIKKTRNLYFGDFKVGVDDRFKIDVGDFVLAGEGLTLVGYDEEEIKRQINIVYKHDIEQRRLLLKLVKRNPSYKQHKELHEAIRKNYILRWSIHEIEKGFKKQNGKEFFLNNVLFHDTIVKIDVYALIFNRFIEITNTFFFLENINGTEIRPITTNLLTKDQLITRIKKDIEIFKILKKNMKVAKRMWNLAYLVKDEPMIKKLYSLFVTPLAKFAQVLCDIDTFLLMISKLKNPPTRYMIRSIQDIMYKMGSIPSVILPKNIVYEIYAKFNSLNNNTTTEELHSILVFVHDKCAPILDRHAKAYLQKNVLA